MVILLVDDDREDREFFTEAVAEIDKSIECIEAINGHDAISILNQQKPEFIFLDINMPIMGGKDCLRKIKSSKRLSEIPVVMFSTSTSKAEIDECIKLGAVEYIIKPYSIPALVASLLPLLKNPVITALSGRNSSISI